MLFLVLRGRVEPCASVKRSLRQGNMSFRGGSDGSSSHFFHPDLLRLSHVIPCSWSLPFCSYMFIPVLCLLDGFLPTSPRFLTTHFMTAADFVLRTPLPRFSSSLVPGLTDGWHSYPFCWERRMDDSVWFCLWAILRFLHHQIKSVSLQSKTVTSKKKRKPSQQSWQCWKPVKAVAMDAS